MGSCETLEELEADRRSHYSACADLVFEDYPFEDSVAAIGELARSKRPFSDHELRKTENGPTTRAFVDKQ